MRPQPICAAVLTLLLGLGAGPALGAPNSRRQPQPGVGTVAHTLLDEGSDEGAILKEARQVGDDLLELGDRLDALALQAEERGDGEMLSCARRLEREAHTLQ